MSRYHRQKHSKKHHVLISKKAARPLLVDRATFVVAVLEPVITIPQAWTIFTRHNATGVSLSTWIGFEIATAIWLWYSIVHKERMIMLYQGLFAIVQAAVIAGGVTYGAHW